MIASKLSSVALVRDAVVVIVAKRVALSHAVFLPILGTLAIQIYSILYFRSIDYDDINYVVIYSLSFASLPLYVMFATACHRIVLLGDDSLTNRWGVSWSMRETRFAGWLFVLGAVSAIVTFPIWTTLWFLPSWAFDWPLTSITMFASALVSAFVDGRFSLVLPATAIGRQMALLNSWRISAGNSWSIFIALAIPIIAMWLIDYILFDFLFTSNQIILDVLGWILFYPIVAVGVVIITLVYRTLVLHTEDEGPPPPRRRFYFES